ncbi:hypothetical protein FRACYDRAFT_241476 [Fragilariopsis cylindrus CCMP1102]|uniref:Uncharacterized protein n=1 Tax=Fragilariopsis cylindrus CCMP1102 TaxID=635003 RepID=A0A1E7F9S7_9STRA|nr:hypothetical protein FRACYDRAFT_241476 [Fragilariopsis cylindrus CCMP1102]|eukprot:OEU14918.1 hypothetical protein FRACYDRAFT_241476 [Fragilariopsis cylindrus CCMP1102]
MNAAIGHSSFISNNDRSNRMNVFGTDVLDWDPWAGGAIDWDPWAGGESLNSESDDEGKKDNTDSNNSSNRKKQKKKKKVVRGEKSDDTDCNKKDYENGEDGTVPLSYYKDNDNTKESKVPSSSRRHSSKGRGRTIIKKRRSRSSSNHHDSCSDSISRRSHSVSDAPTITNQKRRSRRRQPEGQDQDAALQKRVYGSDSKQRRSSVKDALAELLSTLDTHDSDTKNRPSNVKNALGEFLSIDDDDNNINTTALDTQSENISSSSKPKLRSRDRRIGGKKNSRSSGNQSVASAPTAANEQSKTRNPPRCKSHASNKDKNKNKNRTRSRSRDPSHQGSSLSVPKVPREASLPPSLSRSYLPKGTQKRVSGSDSRTRRSIIKDALEQCLTNDDGVDDNINININKMTSDTQSEHISSSSSKPKMRSRELRKGGSRDPPHQDSSLSMPKMPRKQQSLNKIY